MGADALRCLPLGLFCDSPRLVAINADLTEYNRIMNILLESDSRSVAVDISDLLHGIYFNSAVRDGNSGLESPFLRSLSLSRY